MIVLNVGGGGRYLPERYAGWEQHLLDIDPDVQPDLCCDARELLSDPGQPGGSYDAVYCSHTLEHFYRHDVPRVLAGFLHVLKPGGEVDIAVPNLATLVHEIVNRNHELDDVWYRASGGIPITFHDVLYGWSAKLKSGNLAYAHKCGFTPLSLHGELTRAGFVDVQIADGAMNILARAKKCL